MSEEEESCTEQTLAEAKADDKRFAMSSLFLSGNAGRWLRRRPRWRRPGDANSFLLPISPRVWRRWPLFHRRGGVPALPIRSNMIRIRHQLCVNATQPDKGIKTGAAGEIGQLGVSAGGVVESCQMQRRLTRLTSRSRKCGLLHPPSSLNEAWPTVTGN